MRSLGLIFVAATALAVTAVERSVAGAGWGLLGAMAGLLIGLATLQLGTLTGALAFGSRVHRVVIGFGGLWKEWRTSRRSIVLRGFPVLLSVSIGPGRSPVRLRMWATALCSALLAVGVVTALWLGGLGGLGATGSFGSFGRGVAIAATATVAHALVPHRSPSTTSTGWLLVGLPRLPPGEVAELAASTLADDALAAVNVGDLPTADAAVRELAERFPGLRSTRATRVAVLEAHGRYGEALAQVLGLVSKTEQSQRDMAFSLAGLAGIAAAAVEAGEVPAEVALPIAAQAVTDAEQLGYPSFKLNGTRALLALLDGDPVSAVKLARSAASGTDHALTRADDLATLARALMAGGDNRGARLALAEAETIANWWPRVAGTRTRLDVA